MTDDPKKDEARRAKKRAYMRRYYLSHKPDWRARLKKWRRTPKGRASGRAARKRWMQTPHGRKHMLAYWRERYRRLRDAKK